VRRIIPLVGVMMAALPASGCYGLGWYRAVGHFPGVAPSDYAFYNFCGTSSQLFQFPAPMVEASTIQVLGDMGFQLVEPPSKDAHGMVLIRARAQDGRPVMLTIAPQGNLTNLQMTVGPFHVGDELLSRDLIRRVGLNFGTIPRDYTPLEPALARRVNLSRGVPPRVETVPPPPLEGEGLRPGAAEEPSPPSGLAPPGVISLPPSMGMGGSFIPTRDFPNPPTMPYAPWPYTPYTPFEEPPL
jgi:hypothetical protein